MISGYVTIAVALLTIAGGMITYAYQRRNDRRNHLIEIRRTAYRSFISALLDQIEKPTLETQHQLLKCEFDLFVIASDATLRRVGEFSRYMIDTSFENKEKRDIELHKRQLAAVFLAMRRDCFEKSKFSNEEVIDLMPIR